MDLTQLLAFCVETQRDAYEGLQLGRDSPRHHKFLARLQSESLAGMHAPKVAQRFRHRWPQSSAEGPSTIFRFNSPLPKFSSNLKEYGVVAIDNWQEILDEYRRHLSPSGGPGVGDVF